MSSLPSIGKPRGRQSNTSTNKKSTVPILPVIKNDDIDVLADVVIR